MEGEGEEVVAAEPQMGAREEGLQAIWAQQEVRQTKEAAEAAQDMATMEVLEGSVQVTIKKLVGEGELGQ